MLVVGQLIAGFFDGSSYGRVVDRYLADDGEPAGGQVDLDVGDTGNLADLVGYRVRAVTSGHSGDGVRRCAHFRLIPFGC